jgi:hypothetical protein
VEWLLPVVEADPRVATAYADIQFLNGGAPTRRSQVLSEGTVAERLISFLAAGAEAPPWRGVTRREVLSGGGFPVDDFRGFLVECEWAFHLLTRGIARRLPRTLYFKRLQGPARASASAVRNQVDESVRRAALEDHRQRLYRRASGALALPRELELVGAGIDAATALRSMTMGIGRGEELEGLLRQALARAERHAGFSGADRIAALAHVALAQCLAQDRRDSAGALAAAERAAAIDPGSALALSILGRLRLDGGDAFGSLLANAALGDAAPWFAGGDAVQIAAESAFERILVGDAA